MSIVVYSLMFFFPTIESCKTVFITPQNEVNFQNDYGKLIMVGSMTAAGVLFNCISF